MAATSTNVEPPKAQTLRPCPKHRKLPTWWFQHSFGVWHKSCAMWRFRSQRSRTLLCFISWVFNWQERIKLWDWTGVIGFKTMINRVKIMINRIKVDRIHFHNFHRIENYGKRMTIEVLAAIVGENSWFNSKWQKRWKRSRARAGWRQQLPTVQWPAWQVAPAGTELQLEVS